MNANKHVLFLTLISWIIRLDQINGLYLQIEAYLIYMSVLYKDYPSPFFGLTRQYGGNSRKF